MKYISVVLRSILIVTLFSGTGSGMVSSEKPVQAEEALKAIEDCMDSSPAPWNDEWKTEYIKSIRNVIELNRDVPYYSVRLEILRKGFQTYWGSFEKTDERSLFEVHQAQIRWYIEHMMSTEFPSEDERQKLRDHYKDLWNYAADSLLEQFPFLDPNVVQKAKRDDLNKCHSNIEVPLVPVYLKSMSGEQVEQIKQRWNKLRYIRVDLLRRLGDGSKMPLENNDTLSSGKERDYQLTKNSLSQLLGLVWTIVPERPEYYLNALENRNKALKHRIQSKRMARSDQQRLEKERSRQLLQTEHISFLLAALLETPACLDGSESVRAQELTPSEQREKPSKGGGAYEVDNGSPKK